MDLMHLYQSMVAIAMPVLTVKGYGVSKCFYTPYSVLGSMHRPYSNLAFLLNILERD